jgi:hypothetical protein
VAGREICLVREKKMEQQDEDEENSNLHEADVLVVDSVVDKVDVQLEEKIVEEPDPNSVPGRVVITLATLHAMTAEVGTEASRMFNELKRRLDLIFADLDRVHHSAEDVAAVNDLVFHFCTMMVEGAIFYFFCEKCFEISLKLSMPYPTRKRRWIVNSNQRKQVDTVWLVFRRHGFPRDLTQHVCEEFLESSRRKAPEIVKKTMTLARLIANLGRHWTKMIHHGALVELPDWGRLRIQATLKEMVILIVEKVLFRLEFGENQPEDQGVDEAMKTAN